MPGFFSRLFGNKIKRNQSLFSQLPEPERDMRIHNALADHDEVFPEIPTMSGVDSSFQYKGISFGYNIHGEEDPALFFKGGSQNVPGAKQTYKEIIDLFQRSVKAAEGTFELEKKREEGVQNSVQKGAFWGDLAAAGIGLSAAAVGNMIGGTFGLVGKYTTFQQLQAGGFTMGQQVAAKYAMGPYADFGVNFATMLAGNIPLVGAGVKGWGEYRAAEKMIPQQIAAAQFYSAEKIKWASDNAASTVELGQRNIMSQWALPEETRAYNARNLGIAAKYADAHVFMDNMAKFKELSKTGQLVSGGGTWMDVTSVYKQISASLLNMEPQILRRLQLEQGEYGISKREYTAALMSGAIGPGTMGAGWGSGSTAYGNVFPNIPQMTAAEQAAIGGTGQDGVIFAVNEVRDAIKERLAPIQGTR